jgi:hypothetical protein
VNRAVGNHREACWSRPRSAPGRHGGETQRTSSRLQGATDLRLARGGSRRGGEKPRGRNGTAGWNPAAEVSSSERAGVDASVEMSAERRSESHERRPSSEGQLGRGHTLKEK